MSVGRHASHQPAVAVPADSSDDGLERALKSRHVGMITIGSCVGMGFFLASPSAISRAGPSVVLAYVAASGVVFLILRALGELLLFRPVSGSFACYAEEFVGRWAGFVTGWAYWLLNVVVGIAQITAAGIVFSYWYPQSPQWLIALAALLFLYVINLSPVRAFGEFAVWFSALKLVTVLAVVVVGLAVAFLDGGERYGVDNFWAGTGFSPQGVHGLLLALPVALVAFIGAEAIGTTAGEATDPSLTIPRAIKHVSILLGACYVGSLIVILMLLPWNTIRGGVSPFVAVFDELEIPAAGTLVNVVILTAVLSAGNSEIYSTGRMIFALGGSGYAPVRIARVDARGVPVVAISASSLAMLTGVGLNYLVPGKAFGYVVGVASGLALWVWGMTVVAHLCYRRRVTAGFIRPRGFQMPGAPYTDWLVLFVLVGAFVGMVVDTDGRAALFVVVVLSLLAVAALWTQPRSAGQALP
jgi:amino acid transporter, AAT family